LFFFTRYGVAEGFFSTRPTWLHAQADAVWMCKHATFDYFSTRTSEPSMDSQNLFLLGDAVAINAFLSSFVDKALSRFLD
jgi:hypothetical protein